MGRLDLSIMAIMIATLLSSCNVGEKKDGDRSGQSAPHAGQYDPYLLDSIAYGRWGDPSSPYRDEERYISFLNRFLACDTLPETLRLRAEERLRVASLNRVGSIAHDFEFVDRHGRRGSLHATAGDRIMLIFYDPECPHCNDILRELAASPDLNEAIASGGMTVIAIYAEGKRDIWERTKGDLPAAWQVGYDLTGILDSELYHLPAMPVIYLLDPDHRILLKDPDHRIFLPRK